MEISLTPQAKVRLQAKSSKSKSKSKPQPPSLGAPITTEKHEETYADIASHPADPSAPVVTHNPELDLDLETQKESIAPRIKEDGGAIELLTRVYREKGIGGWYKGLGAQIVKAVLCQGMSISCFPLGLIHEHLHLHLPSLYRLISFTSSRVQVALTEC